MTYILDPNPVFWAPVTVRNPGEDGTPHTFRAQFKALDTDDFDRVDLSTPAGTRQLLEETLMDIDDVIAIDNTPLAFDALVFDKMVRAPHIRAALVTAYLESFRRAVSGN